jgi:membrane-associated phospholipid phosphatase
MNLDLFYAIYNFGVAHPSVRFLAQVISGPLSYIIFPILIIGFLTLRSKKKIDTFALIFLSTFLAWVSARTLKEVFHLMRPDEALNLTTLIPLGGYSFPSEHAAVYGAISVVLFHFDYRFGMVGLVTTSLVALSRVVVGAHYPFDVVCGALIGALVSYVSVRLLARLFTRSS